MSSTPYRFVYRTHCPACGSADRIVEVHSPFSSGCIGEFVRTYYQIDPRLLGDAIYELIRCPRCTLRYQSWVGEPRFLAELYGEWINDCNQPASDQTYRQIMSHPLESRDAHEILTAAAFLGRRPDELRTLDYGMGWAMWGRIALVLGCRSFGTELSEARVAFAREHGIECLRDDEIAPESVDFINTEQVMEHLPDLRSIVDRLAKALRPAGILKISVPSANRIEPVMRALQRGERLPSNQDIMPIQPLEHVNSFTSKSITTLADQLGLRIVQPSVLQRYAFLRLPGTISLARMRNSTKELVRPFHQWRSRRNLYFWLQKQPLRSMRFKNDNHWTSTNAALGSSEVLG